MPARSSLEKRVLLSSVWARTPSIPSLAQRSIPTTPRRLAAAALAAEPLRWPAVWRRSRAERILVARCAIRRISATWLGSARLQGVCRTARRRNLAGPHLAFRDPWHATSRIALYFSAYWLASTGGLRFQSNSP